MKVAGVGGAVKAKAGVGVNAAVAVKFGEAGAEAATETDCAVGETDKICG